MKNNLIKHSVSILASMAAIVGSLGQVHAYTVDNFDSLANGSNLNGQSGYTASSGVTVSDTASVSAPNSAEFLDNVSTELTATKSITPLITDATISYTFEDATSDNSNFNFSLYDSTGALVAKQYDLVSGDSFATYGGDGFVYASGASANFSVGSFYTVALTTDVATDSYSVDVYDASGNLLGNGGSNTFLAAPVGGIASFQFGTDSTTTGEFFLDNITVSTPEPSSIALVLAGLAFVVVYARRRGVAQG